MQIDRILVPTDFSDNAKPALEYGCELARQFNAQLQLVNVVDNLDVFPMEMEAVAAVGVGIGGDALQSEKHASRLLAELPGSSGHDCRITRSVKLGNPATEIIRFAKENHTDLIVISTHGRTGLRHLLLGSVAESVVRKAGCPVLTVHPEGHQFTVPADTDQSQPAESVTSLPH